MTEAGTGSISTRPAADDGLTAGRLLRQAREASGLHIAALAVSLKVPVRRLEALEEDRYDEMPDAVFVRGLASSAARALKIDPRPLLERLPQPDAPRLSGAQDGINTPFRAPSDGAMPGWRDHLNRPVVLAVGALLVGALLLLVLPPLQKIEQLWRGSGPSPSATASPSVSTTAGSQAAASAQTIVLSPPTPAPLPVASEPAAVSGAAVAVSPPGAEPASSISTVTAAASAGSVPTESVGVVRARGECWVEVIDAGGGIQVRRNLAAGESLVLTGALPLRVTVGRADAVDIQVRGRALDLKPWVKENVARFEIQ